MTNEPTAENIAATLAEITRKADESVARVAERIASLNTAVDSALADIESRKAIVRRK